MYACLLDTGSGVNFRTRLYLLVVPPVYPRFQQPLKEFFGGNEPSKGINPDDAVAYGAAVQGGILSGEEYTEDILLVDIAALTLQIETTGGVFTKLLRKFELSGIPPVP